MSNIRSEATALYASFPRRRRRELYEAIMSDPDFPFKDGFNEGEYGTWFGIAMGNHPAPLSHEPLDRIIGELSRAMHYSINETDKMFQIIKDKITAINSGVPLPQQMAPAAPEAHAVHAAPAARERIRVADAPHKGDLPAEYLAAQEIIRLPNGKNVNAHDPIDVMYFRDGDEVVVLERAKYGFSHVFRPAPLQQWFNSQANSRHLKNTSPTTRKKLLPTDLERYTIVGGVPSNIKNMEGGYKRKSRRKINKKSRKNRRRRTNKN